MLIHTDWGNLWMKDNARYGAGELGISVAAATCGSGEPLYLASHSHPVPLKRSRLEKKALLKAFRK